MRLRPYQEDGVKAVFHDWNRGLRGSLVVFSTGCGKTVTGSEVIRQLGDEAKVLIIVPNEEIMHQFAKSIERVTGFAVGKINAEHKDYKRGNFNIFCGVVNSVTRITALWAEDHFDLLVYDEAHHSPAKSYLSIANRFHSAKLLGLTATPGRTDGQGLGKLFDNVAARMDTATAVEQGWLTPIKSYVRTSPDINLKDVRTIAGEFHVAELNYQLEKDPVVRFIADETMKIAGRKQTVIFCKSIAQSRSVTVYLKKQGFNARHIDGKTPKWERTNILNDFKNGTAQIICNVQVIEEGVDVPGIEVITMASPTKSTTRFIQRAGRGLRPIEPPEIDCTANDRRNAIAESVKPECIIIDIMGQMGEHDMRLSGDLLIGDDVDDYERVAILELIQDISEEIKWDAVKAEAAEIAQARRELDAARNIKRQSSEARRAEKEWCASYRPCPFEILGIPKGEANEEVTAAESHGSQLRKAVDWLVGESLVDDPKAQPSPVFDRRDISRMTNREQVYLARLLWIRSSKGMASWKATRTCWVNGYEVKRLSRGEAKRLIGGIKDNGWLRPEEDGPNQRYAAFAKKKLGDISYGSV